MTQTAPPEAQVVTKQVKGVLTYQQASEGYTLVTHEGDFFVSFADVKDDLDWDAWYAGEVEFSVTATVELVHPTLKGHELSDADWEESPIADRVPATERVDGVVLPNTLKLTVHWLDDTGQAGAKARTTPKHLPLVLSQGVGGQPGLNPAPNGSAIVGVGSLVPANQNQRQTVPVTSRHLHVRRVPTSLEPTKSEKRCWHIWQNNLRLKSKLIP